MIRPLDPGTLRHLVTIQTPTVSADTDGSPLETWATYYKVRASINTSGGREFFQNQQLNSNLTHEVKMQYMSGITSKMRILWGTRIFRISAVLHDEELHRHTVLHCEEVNQ